MKDPKISARQQVAEFMRTYAEANEGAGTTEYATASRAEAARLFRAAAVFVENGGELPLPPRPVGKAPELGLGYCGENNRYLSGDDIYAKALPVSHSPGGHAK